MKTKTYIRLTTVTDTDKTITSYFVDEPAADEIKKIIDNCTDKKTLHFSNEPIETII